MHAYINGIGCISPSGDFKDIHKLTDIPVPKDNFLKSIDPDWKSIINPKLLRRMSRAMKMSLASSIVAIGDADTINPDAIIIGTGMGCLDDSVKFLKNMVINNEDQLNPTPFIQSTHNTIAGQIANYLNCNGYNCTYSQRGLSFETGLIDAMLLIRESNNINVLTGSYDEFTEDFIEITRRMGLWRNEILFGEGSASLLLSSNINSNTYAKIELVSSFQKEAEPDFIVGWINSVLAENNIDHNSIDMIVSGRNFGFKHNEIYDILENSIFKTVEKIHFKQYCGEYFTSGAFGLGLSAKILKKPSLPDESNTLGVRNILMINSFLDSDFSIIYLRQI